ncbi:MULTISPECIES: (3,5-dihydroxyphenyl)acetyl-CoA 1,2-dioxygenase DpgC [Streptomyces]|uniref:(3,5-dihydroxyphenyl)acetyl-CoA 1,2-dioxygenase DpgC n=1 Tax=Streptomyces TaxID=1883 RepID=UPI001CCB838B|nr:MULTISPECIES: (3,5-dihydroxyphenyl)acetyl-CoA 1,2-dioxygenase DpgC [Streptomyces]UBI36107.1 enoyl-CoA hydratase/isomerase family protein [Streptomyces mobaraensis]UKW28702.1 enoyl-CoA hydratase-related protein [Streptomyces sp. TYQ1024]
MANAHTTPTPPAPSVPSTPQVPAAPADAWREPSARAAHAEEILAGLPRKSERTAKQQARLDRAVEDARLARSAFLAEHGQAVYDALTDGRTTRLWLDELAAAAAGMFPGLVPTAAQMNAERELVQEEKEGREIDQAIFFSALLRQPRAGAHLLESMRRPTPQALDLLPAFVADGFVDLGPLRVERIGRAAHVTVTNPGSLNAEDNELIAAMDVAVDLTLLDDGVRVGVLRGGEMTHPKYHGRRVFSAGINLVHLSQGRISYVDFLLRREMGYISKIQHGVLRPGETRDWRGGSVQKPWIAAVDTFAIGGGMQLLFVFDRVIAASDAFLSLPAAQEGIVPGAANLRLPRIGGNRLARQVILSGRRIKADEPDAKVLCDEVVEPEEVTAAVEAAVEELAAPAVVANRAMLNLAEEPPEVFRAYMAEFALQQGLRLYAEDVMDKTTKFSVRER